MAELLQNSDYQDFTLEQLKTPEGIARLNAIIRKLAQDMPGDGEGIKIYKGYGTPESSVTAGVSSLYMRLDGAVGTTLYQKQSGTGNTGWVAVPGSSGGGFGDVVGPASATNNAIVLFDGTTGKLIKDSTTLLSSLGNVTASAVFDDNYIIRGDGGSYGIQTSLVKIDDSGYVRTPSTSGFYVSPNASPDTANGVLYGIATSEEAYLDAVSFQIKGAGSSPATLKIGTDGATNSQVVFISSYLGSIGSGPQLIFSNNKVNISGKIKHSGNVINRVVSIVDGTSITPNVDTTDIGKHVNSQAAGTLTVNAPSGTPDDGQEYLFRINSTNVQTFSWNGIYRGGTVALPTATTGGGKTDYFRFIYNETDSKWDYLSGAYNF